MARHKPTALADLDKLVAAITVDAYGDDEPQTAFLEVFIQEAPLPAAATVLGTPVEVIGFDDRGERRGIGFVFTATRRVMGSVRAPGRGCVGRASRAP